MTVASVTGKATKAGALLLFFAATDSPSGANSLTSVSGGGLTWRFVGRETAQQGDSEIWAAVAPRFRAGFTVTGTEAQPGSAAQTSLVELSSPAGTPSISAKAGASGAGGAPAVTVPGAGWQAAVGNDYCGETPSKASPGQTILDQYDPNIPGSAQDAFWLQTSPTGTISDTSPTDQCWNMEAVSVTARPVPVTTSSAPQPSPTPTVSPTPTTAPPPTPTVSPTPTTAPPPSPTVSQTTTAPPPTPTVSPTTTTAPPPSPTVSPTSTIPAPLGPPFATSVSASGTYLADQYGNPFLVNADSAWNLAWGLGPADQGAYLADRQAGGFNAVVTDLVGNSSMYGSGNGANYAGDLPFTDANFTPNPAYWQKIDQFFQLAGQYGITVFAIPIDAYATTGGNVFSAMTTAQASAFGAFLASRYPQSRYPGIVWMLGNDYDGDGAGAGNVGGFVPQYQAFLTAIAAAGDTRPTMIEQGISESLSTDGHTVGQMVSLNAGYSYHPAYEVIMRGRAAKNIPVLFFEGAYENATTGFPSAPLDIRKQLAWSMTSGAAGTFYGNDSLWQFGPGWQNQLDTTDVAQRNALNAAFAAISWQNLVPDVNSQLVTSGRNSQYTAWTAGPTPYTNDATYGDYVTAAYTSDGTLGVIYNPDTTVNTITISSSVLGANPTITAVDPTDGARTTLGWTTTPAMGTNAGGGHDWLFIITAANK
jgi:hypothetical protein